jgi:murein DD-endopeptidase MepM/ murein hydrolase activator NlpD
MSKLVVIALLVAAVVFEAAPAPAVAAEPDFVVEVFPHPDPETRFSDTWGAARSGGRRHHGTDITAEKLTPVVAVADGFVELMRTGSWLSGNYVTLRHAGEWTSWYLHLNNDNPGTDDGKASPDLTFAPGLEVGDFVKAGDLIGFVGDSGNAEPTVPHTHFELRHDGRAVNPYPYLLAAWERQQRFWDITGPLQLVALY